MRLITAALLLIGLALAVVAVTTILAQQSSGLQPWSDELGDNIIFARTIPFVLGLGLAAGMFGAATARRARNTREGHVRRFSRATVIGHFIITIGFLLALPTGAWQYLGGILDVSAPFDLYLVYRIHYLGAAIILFSIGYFLAYWWQTGHHALWVPRGQWRHHLRGLVHELPPALGHRVARALRLHTGGTPAEVGQFTYYETGFSFPTWTIAIGLITITGLIKALRYLSPVPGPILWGASTLHVAAMVMLVLKVLDHLRYVFGRWPLVVAMTTTWVTDHYARTHFPGWRHRRDRSEAA
jgi:cytochrome b subunit of formate dehydrogenase